MLLPVEGRRLNVARSTAATESLSTSDVGEIPPRELDRYLLVTFSCQRTRHVCRYRGPPSMWVSPVKFLSRRLIRGRFVNSVGFRLTSDGASSIKGLRATRI